MRTINQEQAITFLVVTHERALASYCDRTIQLRDGMVVARSRRRWISCGSPPGSS
jgi:ABC-type lipoprotein export system ATPase subunit